MGLNRYGPAVTGIVSPASASAATGSGGATEAKAVEKTAFDIKLEKYDAAAKIKIIKEVKWQFEINIFWKINSMGFSFISTTAFWPNTKKGRKK